MQVDLRPLWASLRLVGVLALLCGVAYTGVVTGVLQLADPYAANGSLIRSGRTVLASAWVGQAFRGPGWFEGRPSATVNARTGRPQPYNGAHSGGSNLAATNPALIREVRQSLAAFARTYGVSPRQVPAAMAESSGSGLDPDIPLAGALLQVPAISRATGVPRALLDRLVEEHVQGRLLGMFGGTGYVNVVQLNLGLWRLERARGPRPSMGTQGSP